MITFTAEQIQEQFEQLPKEIQDAITSADVHDSIIEIAKKNNLHIDQEGELVDLVGLVMLGLSPSKDFVKNYSASSGVDTATAVAIAGDINTEIFGKIRVAMRNIEEKVNEAATSEANKQSITDLEQIGGFTIEPKPEAGDTGISHIEGKERLINSIENPSPVEIRGVTNENISKTEPLVDHLLSGPAVRVQQKVEQKTADLYREPIQ